MAKHTGAGTGNRNQPDGRHHRQDQTFVTDGEQSVSRILDRLAAEQRTPDPRKA